MPTPDGYLTTADTRAYADLLNEYLTLFYGTNWAEVTQTDPADVHPPTLDEVRMVERYIARHRRTGEDVL